MNGLFHFRGGLRLRDHKQVSTRGPILDLPLPPQLILPLQQHIGEPPEPVVKVGDKVLKGELLARSRGAISAPIHAPSSGTVSAIEPRPVAHPSGLLAQCIVLDLDGRDRAPLRDEPGVDVSTLTPEDIHRRVREAGIVGMGGAGFPTAVKLSPGKGHLVQTLIINGAECEPWITCDDMLMREQAAAIVSGTLLMKRALLAKEVIIAIEDNKGEALRAIRNAVRDQDIRVQEVPAVYPAGGEKQLIKLLTGREIPAGSLPIKTGIVCQNVATAAAVHEAVIEGRPSISRIVTCTGHQALCGNARVLLGTPIRFVLQRFELNWAVLDKLVVGGPMMGFALQDLDAPVTKTVNCLLSQYRGKVLDKGVERDAMPCIRCGLCADACPAELLPQQLYWYARARDFDRVQDFHLFDCIECGCCDYVCPAHIPLVQYYRFAKAEIWARDQEKRKADVARRRHEFRQFRLQREKEEKAARHKLKAAALQRPAEEKAMDAKKAAIQAAVERVRARKAAADTVPKNTENLTEEQQRLIAEVDERRARQRREQQHKDE